MLIGLLGTAIALVVAPCRAAGGDLVWEVESEAFACPGLAALGGAWFTHELGFTQRGKPLLRLRAHDAGAGEVRWQSRGRAGFDTGLGSGPRLVAADDRVYSVSARPSDKFRFPGWAAISAHDALTGEELWRVGLHDQAYRYSVGALAAVDGMVFATGTRTARPGFDQSEVMLLALEGATGEVVWSDFSRQGFFSTGFRVIAGAGRVVALVDEIADSSIHKLRAHDLATGRLLWERELTGRSPREMVVQDRTIVVAWALGAVASIVDAFDLHSGVPLWTNLLDAVSLGTVDAGRRTVAAYGQDVRNPGFRATVRTFDRATGAKLWGVRERRAFNQQVIVSRGRVFTVADRNLGIGPEINSYRAASAEQRWSSPPTREVLGEAACGLLLAGERLVSVSHSGSRVRYRAYKP